MSLKNLTINETLANNLTIMTNALGGLPGFGRKLEDSLAEEEALEELVQGHERVRLVHAVLMSVAWVLIAPTMVILALLRRMGINKNGQSATLEAPNTTYMLAHKIGQSALIVFTLIGMFLVLSKNEWKISSESSSIKQLHGWTGVLIVTTALAQLLMWIFRTKPEPGHNVWLNFHRYVGLSVLIVGMVNCVIGGGIYEENYEGLVIFWYAAVILGGISAIAVIVLLVTVLLGSNKNAKPVEGTTSDGGSAGGNAKTVTKSAVVVDVKASKTAIRTDVGTPGVTEEKQRKSKGIHIDGGGKGEREITGSDDETQKPLPLNEEEKG
ncbi:unnamed protein product [Amoebophrya sp. A120]|nr:unnamed protein product [Amoebophrya sp. A120]|eukprot:GSA120T00024277001.1